MTSRNNALALLLMAITGSVAATGGTGNAGGAGDAASQPQSKGNRIEVTGNRAENVRIHCKSGNSASINSVNVNGKALKGETIIITGRNVQDVHVEGDCEEAPDSQRGGNSPQINSITIR